MRTKGVLAPFHKFTFLLTILVLLSSCIAKNDVAIKLKNPKNKNNENVATPLPAVTVSNIQVVNHQIIITGTNLASVSQFKIKEGSTNTTLHIESKTANQIVANTLSNVTFAAGKILDFILSNAEAAATFTVNFSLCDSSLGGKGFNCLITPNDKEVLSYDAASGKWKPRAVNGLSYQGSWDANDPQPTTTTAGDYFIVSVANAPYSVGDWIVFNGASFDHINNSSAITTVFGRTGAVTANEADYVLDKMGDVDLTTSPPITGDVLKYNGTRWVPGTVSAGSGGTVTNVTGLGPISVTSGASTPAISISQATTTTNGFLTSTDWNTFNNKQPTITAGTTAQYYRGDKTWQTLDTSVVPENVNLYFTNARVLGVPLTGFSANNAVIAATDTILQAFGKAQGQIDNLTAGGSNYIVKNGNDTVTGVVNFNTVGALSIGYTPTNLTDATSKSYVDTQRDSRVAKAGDTMSGDLQLNTNLKFKDSGSNTATIQAPTTITTSYVLRLPAALGTNNQVLTTDAAGNLSWTTPATGGAPTGSAGGDLGGTYPNPTISGLAATKVGGGAVDNTEFGYLDGVTSSIQTQLNAKLSSFTETDPSVSAFAKAALPTCAAGEVLKSNGTTLSCVTDNSGAGAFTGSNNVVAITDGSGALASSSITTTELGRLSGVTSNIQTQLNAKQATIDKTTVQDVSKLRIYGANTTNYVELSAATLTGNRSLIFPDSNGSNGHVLSTDGAGILSWIAIPSAPVLTVHGRTGAVVSANGDYSASQITNVAAGNISAITVQTAINELDTEKQNISSFAADVRGVVLTGLSTATNAAIAATDSILVAFGKLQAQITGQATDISNKADRTNITQTITAATVTGLSAPLVGADATNKTYVDDRIANASNQWTLSSGNVYRSSGNVGIGTNNPTSNLHMVINETGTIRMQDSQAAGSQLIIGEGTGSANLFSPTFLGTSVGAARFTHFVGEAKVAEDTGTVPVVVTSARRDDNSAITTRPLFDWRNASTSIMTMSASGKVGIGTTTPANALDVATTEGIRLAPGTPSSTSEALYNVGGTLYWNGSALNSTTGSGGTTWQLISKNVLAANATTITINGLDGNTDKQYKVIYKIKHNAVGSAYLSFNGDTAANYSQNFVYSDNTSALISSQATNGFYMEGGSVTVGHSSFGEMTFSTTTGEARIGVGTVNQSNSAFAIMGALKWNNTATNITSMTATSSVANGFGVGSYVEVWAQRTWSGVSQWNTNGGDIHYPAGRVGIGTNTPTVPFEVRKPVSDSEVHPYRVGILATAEGTDVSGRLGARVSSSIEAPSILTYRSRGTIASPATVIANDALMSLVASAYDGTTWTSGGVGGGIGFLAEENWTSTNHGSYINFTTTASGAGGATTERMRITGNGKVGIGTTTPSKSFHIKGLEAGIFLEETTGGADNEAYLVHFSNIFQIQNRPSDGSSSVTPYSFDIRAPSGTIIANSSGNIGIGGAPSFKLDVNGSIAAVGALQAHSDLRLKKNIVPVKNALDKLAAIKGVYYDWRKAEFPELEFEERRQLGVIAQDVEKVFPEAVTKKKDGIRSVAYTMLIAPVIEAIKELYSKVTGHDKQIATQARQIASLKAENAELKERLDRIEKALSKK